MTASPPQGAKRPAQSRPLTALLEGLPLVASPLAQPATHSAHSPPPLACTVALIGAGGKTTLLYALARELTGTGFTVITSTTTHIFQPTPDESPLCLLSPTPAALQKALSQHKHVTVAGKAVPAFFQKRAPPRVPKEAQEWTQANTHMGTHQSAHMGAHMGARMNAPQGQQQTKLEGLSPSALASLRNAADVLLVEADGAAMRPLKAPAEHEPAVPPCTDLCIALCGLDGVGHPLRDSIHRPECASALCGALLHHTVIPEHLAHISLHPQGLFRTTPPLARRVVLCMLPQGMPLATGLDLTRQAAQTATQLYPADNSAWWAGSAREGWVIEVAPPPCSHLPMDRHCIPL